MNTLSFVLNLPYTLVGVILALISIPQRLSFSSQPYALIFKVKNLWWTFWYFKNARAVAIGHVIILGPNIEDRDLEHELIHVEQYQREPLIYPFLYLTEIILKGYQNNKYEVEAYSKAANLYKE